MIQHIKNTSKLFSWLLFLILFSCEKASSQQSENKRNELKREKREIQNNWKFKKIFSLAPNSEYACDNEKYEKFSFRLNYDSVFINNNYTDDVYITNLSPKSYFKEKYLLAAYQKRLKDEFNLEFPSQIKTIRNKKAYDKSSHLDNYFRDAFFINKYMFFEDNGCVICLVKNDNSNFKKLLKSISKDDLLKSDNHLEQVSKEIFVNDREASIVYKLVENVFITWFDGDNEEWYLVTFKNDKLYDKLLIGKSETIETKNGSLDNYIDFVIDENLKITLKYITGKNFTSGKIKKTEIFKVNVANNEIEKL